MKLCIAGTFSALRILCFMMLVSVHTLTYASDYFEIPFRYVNSYMLVDVLVDQKIKMSLLFDTGSEHNIIFDKQNFYFSSSPFIREITVFGADLNVEIPALVSRPFSLKVGTFPEIFQSLLVLKEHSSNFDQMIGESVHGILSASLFKNYLIQIDYRRKNISLRSTISEKKLKNFSSIPLEIYKTKPYLACKVRMSGGQQNNLRLLMDTGAGIEALLYNRSSQQICLPAKLLPAPIGSGLGGVISGALGRSESLCLQDSICLQDVPIYIQELLSDHALKELDFKQGLLGNKLWENYISILDYSNNTLWLKKNSGRKWKSRGDHSGISLVTTGSDRSLNIFIQYVIPGSPGSESGLLPGDKLITINGWSVKLLGSLQTVNKFLRRDADKVLRIKVKRHDKTLIKKLTLRNYLE